MEKIIGEIAELVGGQLGIAKVNPSDQLLGGLGAESADLVNIVAALEDRYQITIDESELSGVDTVADLANLVRSRRTDGNG